MKILPYKTLKSNHESELKEKKSIFLSKAFPVSSEDDVNVILNDLKKKYYDASHRCYAFRLLSGKSKFSDAGEPSGTAGIRILNAIDHYTLHDCLVVVIRYFGGTKLGIGPLGKAYYSSAIQVICSSEIITKKPYVPIEMEISISSIDKLIRMLASNQIKVLETSYDSKTILKCLISFENIERVKTKIQELLKGEVNFSLKDEIIFK